MFIRSNQNPLQKSAVKKVNKGSFAAIEAARKQKALAEQQHKVQILIDKENSQVCYQSYYGIDDSADV